MTNEQPTIEERRGDQQNNYGIHHPELRVVTGFCDICGVRETGFADALKSEGWCLGEREHFCPNCND